MAKLKIVSLITFSIMLLFLVFGFMSLYFLRTIEDTEYVYFSRTVSSIEFSDYGIVYIHTDKPNERIPYETEMAENSELLLSLKEGDVITVGYVKNSYRENDDTLVAVYLACERGEIFTTQTFTESITNDISDLSKVIWTISAVLFCIFGLIISIYIILKSRMKKSNFRT